MRVFLAFLAVCVASQTPVSLFCQKLRPAVGHARLPYSEFSKLMRMYIATPLPKRIRLEDGFLTALTEFDPGLIRTFCRVFQEEAEIGRLSKRAILVREKVVDLQIEIRAIAHQLAPFSEHFAALQDFQAVNRRFQPILTAIADPGTGQTQVTDLRREQVTLLLLFEQVLDYSENDLFTDSSIAHLLRHIRQLQQTFTPHSVQLILGDTATTMRAAIDIASNRATQFPLSRELGQLAAHQHGLLKQEAALVAELQSRIARCR